MRAGKGSGSAKRRTKKRSHEYLDGGLVVHGAFATKAKAESKRARVRGGFVVRKFARWGGGSMSTRYVVFSRDAGTEFSF
jgi:hypothetical protein